MASVPFPNRPFNLRDNVWLIRQETANNRSLVGWQLWIDKTSYSPTQSGGIAARWMKLDGAFVHEYYGNGFNFVNGDQFLIASGERWITHNADGTKSLPIQAQADFDVLGTTPPLNSNIPLPTIPRASVATFTGGSAFDMGTTITVNTNRSSTAFTHTIWLTHNTLGNIPIGENVGASTPWTIPTNLLDAWPSHTQVMFSVWTRTLQNGQRVGLDQKTNLTVRLPASAVPTVTGISAADQNPDVASVVGKMVQGLSRAKLTVTGAGIHGSVIASATATLQGTTVPSGGEIDVTGAGSLTVTGSVIDSRGRVGSSTGTLDVLAYQPPHVTNVQVRRSTASGVLDDDGTSLRVDLNAAVQSLINTTQRNALTISVFTRPYGGTVWTPRNVINHSALTYNASFVVSGGANYPIDDSFDVHVRVADKFITSVSQLAVATSEIFMHWDEGGLGVMKYRQFGALDVGGPIFQDSLPVVDIGDVASEAVPGIAELATQAEVDGGDATRIVTASKIRDAAWGAYSEARGKVTCAASGVTTVTFPAGRFSVPPNIQATPVGNAVVGYPHVTGITATSVEIRFWGSNGVQAAGVIDWVATQATATTAGG